jgi:hypothetical protein
MVPTARRTSLPDLLLAANAMKDSRPAPYGARRNSMVSNGSSHAAAAQQDFSHYWSNPFAAAAAALQSAQPMGANPVKRDEDAEEPRDDASARCVSSAAQRTTRLIFPERAARSTSSGTRWP